MRSTFTSLMVLLGIIAGENRLRGQGPERAVKDERANRLEEMSGLVHSFQAFSIDRGARMPVPLKREPLHRWNDPTRSFSDGSLWAWGTTGRPIAFVTCELYPHEQFTATWSFEFVSLSATPIEVECGPGFEINWGDLSPPPAAGRLRWTPRESGIEFRAIPGAPTPARTEAERRRQIKDLTARFSAREFYAPTGQRYTLRLLPRPIDHYADPQSGLLDGAIFLFANGTNPEILLLIEAQEKDPALSLWRFGAAKLSRAEATVSLDQKDVWSRPLASRPMPGDSYFIARKVRTAPPSSPGRTPP